MFGVILVVVALSVCLRLRTSETEEGRDGGRESGGAEFYAFNADSREVSTMLARGVKHKSSKQKQKRGKKRKHSEREIRVNKSDESLG